MKIFLYVLIGAALLLSPFCIRAQVPGTKLWDIPIGIITQNTRPVSSPAIGLDGTIYVGSNDPLDRGRLYAINPNGTTNWIHQTTREIRSSPAIGPNGQIYFGSVDGIVWSFNPDGATNWFVQTGARIYSSPAIAADGTIYIGFGTNNVNKLLALNPNGTTNWVFTMGAVPNYPAAASFQFPSPSIGSDGTIYVGSSDKKFYAINPDGTTNWVFNVGTTMFSSPTIGSDGTVYFGSDTGIYAFTPDGRQKWYYAAGYVESTAATGLTNSLFFGVVSGGGLFYATTSGQSRGKVFSFGGISASPAIAADGTVYIASYEGTTFNAFTRYYTNKWTYNSLAGPVFASPTIAPDGTVYLVAGPRLYAFYETNPPLSSASPMFRRNAQHTARAVQVAIKNIARQNDGNVKMDLHIEPNLNYTLRATTNLVDWLELTNFLSTSLSSQFIDDTATNFPSRYYRLTSP